MEMMSEQIAELATALSKAQGEFGVALHDKKNPHFKNAYSSLQSVHDMIRGPLAKNGLSVSHLVLDGKMYTTLFHTTGQWMRCEIKVPDGLAPQQLGSAFTYFRRYSLYCLLAIPSGEDDDGNQVQEDVIKPPSENSKIVQHLTFKQIQEIESLLGDDIEMLNKILSTRKVSSLKEIPAKDYPFIMEVLKDRQ